MNKNVCKPLVLFVSLTSVPLMANAETLQDSVTAAITKNPQVLIDVNERRARDYELKQAKADYLPTLDLNAGYGTEWSNNPTTRASGDKWVRRDRGEAGLFARQMVFDGFATPSEVDRQTARINSQAYRVQGSSQNTALDAVEVFLNIIRRQRSLELARQNYQAHERIYDQIELRSESGVGRKADLDQAKGRRALAHSNVIAEEGNLRDAFTNYQRVIGEMPKAELIMPESPKSKMPADIDAAVQQALNNHPTLKSANADIEATYAQHEASKHTNYPRFDIEVGRRWDNNLDGARGTDQEILAMLRMRYNLFRGGKDQARIKQTAELINEAKSVRDNTYREVIESIRLSWNSYISTGEQLKYLTVHRDSAKKSKEAYVKQFNLGKRTLLDLLDTENEVFESELAYLDGEFGHLFAQYRVLNGLGELTSHLGIQEAPESKPLEEKK